jgi:hypothetical protein
MAATAVGLFANASVAESVAEALRANAVPSQGIRILTPPANGASGSAIGTTGDAFVAKLSRDLRSMGAVDGEIDAYIAAVQRGRALVFATGTLAQADAATAVMNEFGPIEVEEFAGAVASSSGKGVSEAAAGVGELDTQNISLKEDRMRAKTEGARLFSW